MQNKFYQAIISIQVGQIIELPAIKFLNKK